MNQKQPAPELEHLSKETADALDLHEAKIKTFIAGSRKGAAECFGYAFLAGVELLAARETLPNGNTGDRSVGFMAWAKPRFEVNYRTITRWMEFARLVHDSKEVAGLLKRSPRLFSKPRLSVKDRATILEVVPLVLDGKGMMQYMRDTQLLRDPEKPKHHPRQKVDAEKARAAKIKQAVRHWENIVNAQALGDRLLKLLDKPQLQQILDRNLSTNELLRALIKAETNGGNKSNQ